ncbi:MAG: TIGR01458 family HAD-type hydrolase [Methanoregula sp.]|nr:TIGR01458 family HAD-type hydrolase [Methanoregula sp.]
MVNETFNLSGDTILPAYGDAVKNLAFKRDSDAGLESIKGIKGFLIDLDGVLYVGDRPFEGAQAAIEYLMQKNYTFRFVSNTTRKCRKTIASRLSAMGFSIPEEYIFTPPLAAITYMKKTGKRHCYLLTTGDVDRDFERVCTQDTCAKKDYVIVGDAGDTITYDSLNAAFRHLMGGAELIALEKDRYWMANDGLSLSAGPFVQALEFASGKTATVMGKPSKTFFDLALRDMGLQSDQVAMIGDDITTDIGGAHNAGMKGILVRTGKFREETLESATIKPTHIIDSIAHLKDIL